MNNSLFCETVMVVGELHFMLFVPVPEVVVPSVSLQDESSGEAALPVIRAASQNMLAEAEFRQVTASVPELPETV